MSSNPLQQASQPRQNTNSSFVKVVEGIDSRKKISVKFSFPNIQQLKQTSEAQIKNSKALMMKRIEQYLEQAAKLDYQGMNNILSQVQSDVRDLIALAKCSTIYEMVNHHVKKGVDNFFQTITLNNDKRTPKDILPELRQFWTSHCLRQVKISEAFSQVQNQVMINYNKYSFLQAETRMDVDTGKDVESPLTASEDLRFWQMGLNFIKQHLDPSSSQGSKLLQQVVDDIIFHITSIRQQFIDKKHPDNQKLIAVRDVLKMFESLGIYYQHFEGKYIERTQHFYRLQSNQLISKESIKDYIHLTYDIIENESIIVQNFLKPQSLDRVLQALEQVMIKDHQQQILDKGFQKLLQSQNFESLELLFNFFEECSLLTELRYHWAQTIRQECLDIFKTIKEDQKVSIIIAMKKIFELKDLTDKVFNICFEERQEFKASQKEGFEIAMNQDMQPDKMANYIALYVDKLMQKENISSQHKSLKHELSQIKCETIISVFRYLTAKDTFEAFFTKYLSERLIKRKSESWEDEKEFIAKLKNECGNQFTQRVEQMFADIELSRDLTRAFIEKKKGGNSSTIESEYLVLSSNSWPISRQMHKFVLPKQIQDTSSKFESFYKQKHQGRVLNWSIDFCSSIIKGVYEQGQASYQFEASGVQSLILLSFNTQSKVTYREVQQQSQVFDDFLKYGFAVLASPDVGLLIIEGRDAQIENDVTSIKPETVFLLNESYTSKLKRININKSLKIAHKIKEEQKETEEKVKEDRRFQVDAGLMKIMKKQKTLSQNDLIQELIEYLKCPLENQFIKTRIDSLVDKDYIKRNANDNQLYEYVA